MSNQGKTTDEKTFMLSNKLTRDVLINCFQQNKRCVIGTLVCTISTCGVTRYIRTILIIK